MDRTPETSAATRKESPFIRRAKRANKCPKFGERCRSQKLSELPIGHTQRKAKLRQIITKLLTNKAKEETLKAAKKKQCIYPERNTRLNDGRILI